jgi:hypothetical protein
MIKAPTYEARAGELYVAERPALRRQICTAMRIDRFLYFGAAPIFVILGVLTAWHGEAMPMLCTSMPRGSHWASMSLMYALMGAFHVRPWIKLMTVR